MKNKKRTHVSGLHRVLSFVMSAALLLSIILPVMPGLKVSAVEQTDPLADYLEAYYTFDDANDFGKDSSGNGNHATPYGAVSGVDGIRNGAVKLTGSGGNADAYFEVPGAITNHENLTIMTWAKFDRATLAGWARIFEFSSEDRMTHLYLMANCGNQWDGYRVEYNGPTIGAWGAPNAAGYDNNGAFLPADGEVSYANTYWHHVAVVAEGTTISLYLNGELAATKTGANTAADVAAVVGYIGRTAAWGDPSYNGLLDDFRVYSKALTAEEIAQVNDFAPDDFLVLDLSFDDPDNLAKDTSGNNIWTAVAGRDAAVEGSGVLTAVEGKHGTAAYFDGNDAIKLQDGLLWGSEGLTISSWARFDELPPTWTYLYTFTYDAHRTYLQMSLQGDGYGPSVATQLNSVSGRQVVRNDTPVVTNQWVHLAMTMDDDAITIYMNGMQVAQSTTVGHDASELSWTTANYLGRACWGDADPWVKGSIDEFKIFNYVLSAEQIMDVAGITEGDLNNDLLVHYTFDDPLNLGKDSSGNGNHATEVGNVTYTDGIRDGAASFNGTAAGTADSYFTIPAGVTHRENLTFMTWAKFDRNNLNGWSRLLEFWSEGNGYLHMMADCVNQWDGLWVKYTTAGGEWGVPNAGSYDYEGTGLWLPTNGELAYVNGAWNHLAVVMEGRTMRLYINGHLAATKTGNCSPADIVATVAVLGDAIHEGDKNYNGLMDDVRIYGAALTAQQIAEVNGFKASDFLLLELNFDDETNLIKDTSGNNIWTENTDGQLTAVEGKNGTAAYFDGSDSIRLADGLLYGCEGLTITSWIKTDGLPQSWQYLVSFANHYHSTYLGVSLTGHGIGPSVNASIHGIDDQKIVSNSTALTANEWCHIAVTMDADAVTIYLNGYQVAQSTSMGFDASEMAWTIANYIGRGCWNEVDPWLVGAIDEFKIYSRTLSQSEILEECDIIVPGLKMIYLDGEELLGFSSSHDNYNQLLSVGATEIPEITVETFNKSSNVRIEKPQTLPSDAVITVTEENGIETVYTITFTPMTVEADELKQLTLDQISVEDAFWSPKLQLFQNVMVRDLLQKWDKGEDAFSNFDRVAAGERNTGNFKGGTPWRDSDIYRIIAGAANFLQSNPDEELEALLAGYIDRICAASESTDDGYLICYNLLNTDNKRFDEYDNLWTHNAFQFGHMVRAAVNWYKATGETRFLRAATRFANYVADTYGEGKINMVPAHSEVEEHVLMLYHLYLENPELKNDANLKDLTIHEEDYLNLVKFWINNRGNHEGRVNNANYGVYAQDHALYYNQLEPAGHAVRANLFYNGITLLGRELNSLDASYLNTAMTLWDTITETQMYITGATGSTAAEEKYGGEYDLPNDGYCETCAAMSMGMFSESLGLALGDAKYMDIAELELYNGALGGVGANGNTYFYENPLSSTFSSRWNWHGCPCCPDMFVGYISMVPAMIYAYNGTDLYVNQYIGSTANIPLAGGTLVLKQEADWAWSGTAKFTVVSGGENLTALRLRLPGWSVDNVIKVNGEAVQYETVSNYAVITRTWAAGDTVEIAADMTPQREYADPNVVYDVDRVALRRGPMIYCLEGVDNQVDGLDITRYAILPVDSEITTDEIADLYGGVVSLKADGQYIKADGTLGNVMLTAVPFYARANRENGSVNVWIAEKTSVIPEHPATVTGEKVAIKFNDSEALDLFDLYSSSNAICFKVTDGRLDASSGAELKAILKNNADLSELDVSVDIHVDGDGYGTLNGGIYLLASGAGDNQDQITAYNVHLDSVQGSNDLMISVYKFSENGGYLGNIASTTITDFFQALMPKYDVNLRAVLKDGNIDVYVNNSATPYLEDVNVSDIGVGSVGLRSQYSDISFDNFTIISPQLNAADIPADGDDEPGGNEPGGNEPGGDEPADPTGSDTVKFDEQTDSDKFDFFTSSNGGFVIKDGKLVPTGEEGEFKAIYKDNGAKFSSVSVDIYPGANGEINSGIYIGASKAADGVDKIKALGILVESNFSGWDDAVNRIDLVVGQFPIWKELYRYTSETGEGNALFAGKKEPVNLRVDINGELVTITLSLLSNPSIFVTTVYEYTGSDDLSLGNVGLRSYFNDASFDNFSVVYTADGSADPTPGTGDRFFAAAAAASMMLSAAACVTVIQKKKKED